MPFRKKLIIAAASVLLLLVGAYVFLTSSFFIKTVILPKVGPALGATVTIDDASFSPFSELVLRGLRVQTTGSEPLMAATEVRVRYGLMQIIRGTIAVDELKLVNASVTLVQGADGQSNLDPLLKAMESGPETTAQPTQGAPVKLAIRNVALQQASVRVIQESAAGRTLITLAPVDLTLDKLVLGEPGKVTIGMQVAYQATGAGATHVLEARGQGAFTLKLGPDFMPDLQGNLRVEVAKAEGAFQDARNLALQLDCDLTPTELRNLAFRFEQDGKALGQLRVSGPLELAKSEGRLKIDLAAIDRQVLNLVGAPMGLDFAGTTLRSTNLIDIAQKGSVISAKGQLNGSNVSVRRDTLTTPTMEVGLDYQVTVNLAEQSAVLQKLSLIARQARDEVVRAELDRPMIVSWGANVAGFKESAFQFRLNHLNLAHWQAILGDVLPAGFVDLQLGVLAQQDGKFLKLDLNAQASDITAVVGTNRITQAGASFRMSGGVDEFRTVKVDNYALGLSRANRSLLTATGQASYDLKEGTPGFQVALETALPELMPFVLLTNVTVQSGAVKLNALLSQKSGQTNFSGSLTLADFTGRFADYSVSSNQVNAEWDVELRLGQIGLNRATIALRQGFNRLGDVDFSGKLDPEKRKGQAKFSVTGVNERTLEPFLRPHLEGMTLVSMNVNASGTAVYDAAADTTTMAEFHVSNLLLKDAAGLLPSVPMNLDLEVDGLLRESLMTLNQFVLGLSTPGADRNTVLAGGRISGSGRYDSTSGSGETTFKVEGLNQNALAPLLASSLAPNKLVSAALNGEGSAQYDPKAAASAAATLSLTNLVTADAAGKKLDKPLAVELQLDGSMAGTIVELKKFVVGLAPTPRASNRLEASGRFDLATTNASPSQLTLRSEALDVTPYYDLLAGVPATNAAAAPAPAPAPGPSVEPDPVALPFQPFTFDARIGRFFLRDVVASNIVANLQLKGGVVELSTLQMALNGAPVKGAATINLGVQGWAYEVALSADKVPFEPVAQSFFPEVVSSLGNYDGQVILDTKVKGAGITGASLRQSLAGHVDFVFTNANLQAVKSEAKIWFIPINLKLLATFLGVPEIMQSPIHTLNSKVQLGSGQIQLREVNVLSSAFIAEISGAIPIQEPLENSPLNLGVDLSLRRSLAQKARLLAADAPPGEGFVRLPRLASVGGTIGQPETKTDKLALAAVTARTAAGLVGGKTGDAIQNAGNLLDSVGGLFTGRPPSAPATNTPPSAPSTNALPAAGQTNAPVPLSPLQQLLRGLERKK